MRLAYIVLSQNTDNLHGCPVSAWAVAVEASMQNAISTEALRPSRVIGLTSITTVGLRTLFDPCPLDGVASGRFCTREFAVPDSPLRIQTYQTDRPRVPLHNHLNLNWAVHVIRPPRASLAQDLLPAEDHRSYSAPVPIVDPRCGDSEALLLCFGTASVRIRRSCRVAPMSALVVDPLLCHLEGVGVGVRLGFAHLLERGQRPYSDTTALVNAHQCFRSPATTF